MVENTRSLNALRATPFLTVKETAALLGVSTRTVYAWIQDGRIPSVRLGPKLLRVPTERLLALGQEEDDP